MVRMVALGVSFLMLIGCGGKSYCDRAAKSAEDCGEPISDAELDQCNEALANCSKSDEKQLEAMYDCFEEQGLFECEDTSTSTSSTTGFEDFMALFACFDEISDISSECAAGLEFTSTGTYSTMDYSSTY